MLTFSSDHYLMKEVKLSSYTLDFIEDYVYSASKYSNTEVLCPNGIELNDENFSKKLSLSLIGYNKDENGEDESKHKNGSIYTWDDDSRKYVKKIINIGKKVSDYKKYLQELNKKESERTNFQNLKDSVDEVQNSRDGYIEYKPKLTFYASRKPGDLFQDFEPIIKIGFKNPSIDYNVPTVDCIALTDCPETRGGTLYSRYATDILKEKDGPGSVRPLINNNQDDLRNKVAGYLDTNYNKNTGRFECGNRCVIARLLSDVLGVSYSELPNSIDEVARNDFYSADAQYDQRGDWNEEEYVSDALVLYVHENPNIFGPLFLKNFDTESNANKKEKIKITNRTPSSFSKGEVVLAFYIDGEWLPVKLPVGDSRPPSMSIKKWSFNKIIMKSYNYFRDARYKSYKLEGTGIPDYVDTKYAPNTYSEMIRRKFYYLSPIELKKLNLFLFKEKLEDISNADIDAIEPKTWDIIASDFIQSDIREQISIPFGGYRNKTYISYTNYYHLREGWTNSDLYDMLGFWGPVFKDGFETSRVEALKYEFKNEIDNGKIESYGIERKSFFDNYHIPAELGNNAPPGYNGIGSPFERLNFSLAFTQKNDAEFINSIKLVQNGVMERFNYIKVSESDDTPRYALKVESPNKIDFVPLYAEMVVSTYMNNEADDLPTLVNYIGQLNFEPNSDEDRPSVNKKKPIYSFIENRNIKYFQIAGPIEFWRYVKPALRSTGESGHLNLTWGGTDSDANGNVVGIISSKCSIKVGGQQHRLRINLDQYFGISSKLLASSGGGGALGVIGGTILGSIEGPGAATRGVSTWGRDSNKISDLNITALHIQIYDTWPESQTIVDPRYFAVFHFNPGVLGSEDGETSVDFKQPTHEEGDLLTDGEYKIEDIKDLQNWGNSYIRRGQLLTSGGFRYISRYLVVSQVTLDSDQDSPDGEYSGSGLIVEKNRNVITVTQGGKNLLIRDVLTLSSGSGDTINIKITHYNIESEIKHDLGPQQRVPVTLLTDSNNGGKPLNGDPPGVVSQPRSTLIEIPNINLKGEYDMFFHFHNDITHTVHSADDGLNSAQQHVGLEITTE
jgi:hypothetical protein